MCKYCLYLLIICLASCVKVKDIFEPIKFVNYEYPYYSENIDLDLELHVYLKNKEEIKEIDVQIPYLKYNKNWLMLLTQDDCVHSAFCNTWAAIHGKPLYSSYYYDIAHLVTGDMPPGSYSLGKTLGSTDGTGKEVRFSFTTTLSPEKEWMNETSEVQYGYKSNYYRFKKIKL